MTGDHGTGDHGTAEQGAADQGTAEQGAGDQGTAEQGTATRRSGGGRLLRGVGILGELLLTAGVLIALFVVWQVVWLGWIDGSAQAKEVSGLEQQFAQRPASAPAKPGSPASNKPGTPASSKPAQGTAYAILRIPRLGSDWAKPVHEGVGLDVLAKGIGHYRGTAQPGQIGNAAFAGHRSGHGNPLLDIDALQPGDPVVVETAAGWFTYRMTSHLIVRPTEVDVIEPVPQRPGARATEKLLTLTTCNPRWGNSHRYIVFASLQTFTPRAAGRPAVLGGH